MKIYKIELMLDEHEVHVLRYLISTAADPYATDPLKDIYEMGVKDENFKPYASLATLDRKMGALVDDLHRQTLNPTT